MEILYSYLISIIVQANIPSNTFVVSGDVEEKHVFELIPGIVNQLSPEHLERLSKKMGAQAGAGRGAAPQSIPEGDEGEEDDDDEVPPLVENFEEAAKK